MMLGPVMTLVNGPTIAEAIADPDNAITKLVAREADDAKVVDALFVRILSRPARPDEIRTGIAALHASAGEVVMLDAKLKKYEADLDAKQAAWETSQAAPEFTILEPAELKSSMKATLTRQPDHSVAVEGANGKGTYTITLNTDLPSVTAIRLELLADSKLPAGGPGRAGNGNVVLSELKVTAAPKADPSQAVPVTLARATADFEQSGYPVANAIDGKAGSGWAVAPQFGKDHFGIFEFTEPVKFEGGMALVVTLDHQHDDTHTIGKFRLAVTASPRPSKMPNLPDGIAEILALAPDSRSGEQQSALADYYHSQDAEWVRLRAAVNSAAEQQKNVRLTGAQDLAWALINSPAFLFNR
jgi:hypothetical protein